MLSTIEYTATLDNEAVTEPPDNFGATLQSLKLPYVSAGLYYAVGETKATQGWIIHLSIVISQVKLLLRTIVPFLANKNIAFKIPVNVAVCEDLLSGNLGMHQLGQVIIIYCEDVSYLPTLAQELILLCQSFKGPAIPTDICLGSIVYTRYGAFNPVIQVDSAGIQRNFISGNEGHLVEDLCEMPFRKPDHIPWPFDNLASPTPPQPPTLLNRLYKTTGILKQDPRGNVYKGLYLKNLFTVKKCVIKQGLRNMASDSEGRDMEDRLRWQEKLHHILGDTVPLPKIYNVFQEPGFTLLLMQFVKGCSLFEKIRTVNPLSKHWTELTSSESTQILKYLIDIANHIDRFHAKGYIHRDINPVNFLIDTKDKIILIDIELAYSIQGNCPNPPFRHGTPGFMSPQQEQFLRPTIHDDIYSLGTTFLFAFTGLLPVQCKSENAHAVFENLSFLIGNREIAQLISNCIHAQPAKRPTIGSIVETLKAYNRTLQPKTQVSGPIRNSTLSIPKLKDTVLAGLDGLINSPVVVLDDLWLSKQLTAGNLNSPKTKQFALSLGTSEGISGVLYVLARVYRVGLPIDSNMPAFTKGWSIIKNNLYTNFQGISNGLYQGTAGIAMALAEGIRSGLLDKNYISKEKVIECFATPAAHLNIASGIAGQGLAVLQCKDLLEEQIFNNLADNLLQKVLERQETDGSWADSNRPDKDSISLPFDIAFDNVGITLFLLYYLTANSNTKVELAAAKAIRNITKGSKFQNVLDHLIGSRNSYDFGDGGKGILLMLIKAYHVFHEDNYRKMALQALRRYPPNVIHPNFTQTNGLAALGEIYLEAYHDLNDAAWKDRADWIADLYIHTLCKTHDSSGHWIMDQNNAPTADFLTGISGILHFLTRVLYPDKLGFRLFN